MEEQEPGLFVVVGDSLTGYDNLSLALGSLDDEVEDLDPDSEAVEFFGMHSDVRWEDVEFDFGGPNKQIQAPSIERIREALEHLTVCAWDPFDL